MVRRENGVNRGTRRQKSERLRVLHLLLASFRGGVEEHALLLLKALRCHDFTPYVALPAQLLEEIKPELADCEIEPLVFEKSFPHWPHLIAQLAKMIKRERIDLVHSHSIIGTLCTIPGWCVSGRPVIVETSHGREFWREGKPLKGSFWLDRQSSRFVSTYIAVSHATARFLSTTKGVPSNKIVVIHNGQDLSSLLPPTAQDKARARVELGLRNQQTILLLGRLSVEKGHTFLLEALKRLSLRRPHLTAMFAGIGPLERDLKALCNTLGLVDRVLFLGYRADLSRLLAASDLVVLPSISEGLPLAAVEALASARPVVATQVGGIPEIVLDGETGLLVPPNDSAALAAAIDRILDDPTFGVRLGINGRCFVEQHFDVRLQIERTMTLYGKLTHKVGRDLVCKAYPQRSSCRNEDAFVGSQVGCSLTAFDMDTKTETPSGKPTASLDSVHETRRESFMQKHCEKCLEVEKS
jgi:glycosyltransferase involved in cell wall biosynthesis